MQIFLTAFILIFLQFSAYGSERKQEKNEKLTVKNYYSGHIKPTFKDGWDRTGFGILATGAILGVVARQYDAKVKNHFNREERLGKTLTDFGNSFGTRYVNIMIAGIQMIWDPSNGLAHIEGLLGTTVMVLAMKNTIHRTRPDGSSEDSFPSGHTSAAFSSSGSLSYAYGMKAAIPAYLITSFTFLARLEDNRHWLSDLVVATSIGIFWGRASGVHHHYLSPILFEDGGGIRFSMGW